MRLTLDGLRQEHDRALDKSDGHDKQQYPANVCQCCSADTSKAECLCDGLKWHMLPGGGVECEGHRFARMVDGGKPKRFWHIGRR